MLPAKFIDRYRIDKPDRFRLADFKILPTPAGSISTRTISRTCSRRTPSASATCRSGSMPKTSGRCWSCCRAWTPPARTASSSTSWTGVNPQGCIVHAFKAPSAEELEHDFLWRPALRLPERGRIGIFNRSYYEEVAGRARSSGVAGQAEAAAEPHRQGYLEASLQEHPRLRASPCAQRNDRPQILPAHLARRSSASACLARLDEPAKRWKFNAGDIAERKLWDKYMAAYEDAIRATSREHAPWYVVPADSKPFARLVVARAIVDALSRLDLKFPTVGAADLKEMKKIREALQRRGRRRASRVASQAVLLREGSSLLPGARAHCRAAVRGLRRKPIFRYNGAGPT